MNESKRIVMDLDHTLTMTSPGTPYIDIPVNEEVLLQLNHFKKKGFYIIINTARNMRKYENNIGKISAFTLPEISNWLNKHKVPYDEIHIGKPWCGHEGFYVDDKSIRPGEFIRLNERKIKELLDEDAAFMRGRKKHTL